ncbi:sodium:glutamate symporter [Thalassotalea sp. 1_MG-2023]|uniref:sodium:glutamate symporter n=1 Tax=Thalassotalea sp. 1_MG-2023 TaxID=3062680 RepID=UPI0026E27CDA|nr:sodium:glutamate symporter [Thalassotalea sp. 1_MG-2023]MDO6427518.1 sodium:glutamate symporter [Thalassotalea sp. 1_MG-2023]
MELAVFFKSILLLAFFLVLGNTIKHTLFKGLIIPSSLIAGVLALLLGPQLLGQFIDISIKEQSLWIDDDIVNIWKELPGYLIVVVFAGLFLGKKIPTIKQSINQSLPNLSFGYTIAIGQYVVGMITTLLILAPLFDTKAFAGALIAVGFQGGHGTVAGLQSTFEGLDFAKGIDLGLGIATIGLISAITLGTIMSNKTGDSEQELEMTDDDNNREVKDRPFGLQFAILGTVIMLAWLILTGLQVTEEQLFPEASISIFKYMPLFPVAMLIGLLIQVMLNKFGAGNLISNYQINLLSNLSLDLLIIAALGALNLSVLAEYWQSILLLGAVGVVYSAAIYFIFGNWFFNQDWKIRGIGEVGQSMGTTAVGLLMLKQATTSPDKHIRPFSYKQPLYEPIVGGGIVTALAIPTIANFGPWVFTAIMTTILIAIITGFTFYKKRYLNE